MYDVIDIISGSEKSIYFLNKLEFQLIPISEVLSVVKKSPLLGDRDNLVNVFDEFATNISPKLYVLYPVPPYVSSNGVSNVIELIPVTFLLVSNVRTLLLCAIPRVTLDK